MIDERDIWLVAAAFVRDFGVEALDKVTTYADGALADGDKDGHSGWLRVKWAIHILVDESTDDGTIH